MNKLQPGNNRGFTLPEMMMVLCVMAVMTFIAVPAFMKLLPGMRLNSSARQVYTAFARARQGAVTTNSDACVKFSSSNKTIEAWLDNNPENGAKDNNEPYIFEGALDDGVSIAQISADKFTFNSRGLPKTSSWLQDLLFSYNIRLMNTESKLKNIRVSSSGGIKIY